MIQALKKKGKTDECHYQREKLTHILKAWHQVHKSETNVLVLQPSARFEQFNCHRRCHNAEIYAINKFIWCVILYQQFTVVLVASCNSPFIPFINTHFRLMYSYVLSGYLFFFPWILRCKQPILYGLSGELRAFSVTVDIEKVSIERHKRTDTQNKNYVKYSAKLCNHTATSVSQQSK